MSDDAGQQMPLVPHGAFCCPRCEQMVRAMVVRIAELERERDEAKAAFESGYEAAREWVGEMPMNPIDVQQEGAAEEWAHGWAYYGYIKIAVEQDRIKRKCEWLLSKLREMNIQARALGREWYRASRGAPRKPSATLNIKSPSSVVAWLRYLAWRVRSERGSVLAYERIKSQARADAPRLWRHGKSLAETYGTGAHSRVGVPGNDLHSPTARGWAQAEGEVASSASGGGEDGTAFKDGVEHAAMKLEAIGERSLACFVRFVTWPPRELTQQERDYALTLTEMEREQGDANGSH